MLYAIFFCVAGAATCEMAEPPRVSISGTLIPGGVYRTLQECETMAERYNNPLTPTMKHRCFKREPTWQPAR